MTQTNTHCNLNIILKNNANTNRQYANNENTKNTITISLTKIIKLLDTYFAYLPQKKLQQLIDINNFNKIKMSLSSQKNNTG